MDRLEVTASQLMDALRQATKDRPGPDGALSVSEIADLRNVGRARVQRELRAAMAEGRVECVKKPITDISGRRTYVPAYRPRAA